MQSIIPDSLQAFDLHIKSDSLIIVFSEIIQFSVGCEEWKKDVTEPDFSEVKILDLL
jgi:hypothetical protein